MLVLLFNTGNYSWSAISFFLLVFQFFIVHLRVLPYLKSTFGSTSTLYLTFLVLGFPFGLLLLDGLMFFEPFGLLAILPFPDWLRQFVPAYKATRIIAEVVIESLPQCFLQSYIYIIVLQHAKAGVATDSELAMLQFTAVLPTSIFISTVAMLKLWIEVRQTALPSSLPLTSGDTRPITPLTSPRWYMAPSRRASPSVQRPCSCGRWAPACPSMP